VVFTGSVLRARRVIPPRAFRVVVWLVDQFVCLRVGQISLEISSLSARLTTTALVFGFLCQNTIQLCVCVCIITS